MNKISIFVNHWNEYLEGNSEIRGTEQYPPFFLIEHFKKQNLRIGLECAANLCRNEEPFYEFTAFDMETALPKRITITGEEISRILAPLAARQKAVFEFLSSGEPSGLLPDFIGQITRRLPIRSLSDLENLLALCRPGPLMYLKDYEEDRPCRLEKASEIARQTRGVLLYKEQQELALELLTGCSPDEAIQLRAKNSGPKLNWLARKHLLMLIAKHCSIPMADAEKLYEDWHYYTGVNVRHREVAKAAYGIYFRALEYLRDKGEISQDSVK